MNNALSVAWRERPFDGECHQRMVRFDGRPPVIAEISRGGAHPMTVAFDAKTASVTNVNGVATMTVSNMTVGSGSNRALLVLLWFSTSAVPSGLTVTWDSGGTNQAMTAIPGTDTGTHGGLSGSALMYGLLAPTSGNKSLVISWTGAAEAHAVAISFSGVDQTSVAVAFPHGAVAVNDTAAASPATVTITSATGNMVVGGAMQNSFPFTTISGTLPGPGATLSATE